jgi:hypothetical protein
MATATETPAFSFAGLSIEDADLPAAKRASKFVDNPLLPAFKSSHADRKTASDGSWQGKGKAVVVPASEVSTVEGLIRNAAEQLNLGSRVRYATEKTGTLLRPVLVGGELVTNPATGKARRKGASQEMHTIDGDKKYNGNVRVIFAAKPMREPKSK